MSVDDVELFEGCLKVATFAVRMYATDPKGAQGVTLGILPDRPAEKLRASEQAKWGEHATIKVETVWVLVASRGVLDG